MTAAADHAAWLPLWQGYQRFYKTTIDEATSAVTWQRFLDAAEPMHAALAWRLHGGFDRGVVFVAFDRGNRARKHRLARHPHRSNIQSGGYTPAAAQPRRPGAVSRQRPALIGRRR